jgi:hypothetical protein
MPEIWLFLPTIHQDFLGEVTELEVFGSSQCKFTSAWETIWDPHRGVNQPSFSGSEHHDFLSPPGILRQTKFFSTEPR